MWLSHWWWWRAVSNSVWLVDVATWLVVDFNLWRLSSSLRWSTLPFCHRELRRYVSTSRYTYRCRYRTVCLSIVYPGVGWFLFLVANFIFVCSFVSWWIVGIYRNLGLHDFISSYASLEIDWGHLEDVPVQGRGRSNFFFFLFFGARKRIFYFSAFYFSVEKDSAYSFLFLLSVLKWP